MTNRLTDESPPVTLATEESAGDVDDLPDDLAATATFPIVGVGASAGGLEAFTQFLTALPVDTGMAFVLVQHLSPTHDSALAEILSRATQMPVTEVQDEPTIVPNHVYVIPPARSMLISGTALHLLPRPDGALHRPIDQFFRSLAEQRGHRAIDVVLSGTATDGTLGLEAIKAEGGITFAQDATAQQGGMPHSAVASGCVDFVLPPNEIAKEIARISRHPYVVPQHAAASDRSGFAELFELLYAATNVDFTHYKFNTMFRRITRRMVLQKLGSLAEYVKFLRQAPAEVQALYQDILIGVTSFFRDPEAFATVVSQVFPRLLADRSSHNAVRIWTIGCSTGEEAYSLAIAFTEAAEHAGSQVRLQIFATDVNAAAIDKARAGRYPRDIARDVSPERLRRFFTEVDTGYQINKTIRHACIFSQHNVLTDPPFSRIDLISCRNLLIYLDPVLQRVVIPTLHYALGPAGTLWLGGSESIGSNDALFHADSTTHKVYAKTTGLRPQRGRFALRHAGSPRLPFAPFVSQSNDGAVDLDKAADRIVLSKFAPPGVVVSAELEILHYRGDTGPYLTPAAGKASFSLLKMLREGLLVGVRMAVARASNEGVAVREVGLRVRSNGSIHEVAVEVIPLAPNTAKDGGFLILFEDSRFHRPSDTPGTAAADGSGGASGGASAPEATTARDHLDMARLEHELLATRDFLQSLLAEQESANEQLQSANEEVQSANEELQSANEELETSKEEIQSSNEELATVNEELIQRNAELNRSHNDLVNVLDGARLAIVILGPDLRIRWFTSRAQTLFNLAAGDMGRRFAGIKFDLAELPDLGPLLAGVLASSTSASVDVRDKHGYAYSLRLRPYRTADDKLDGVVVNLVDVDAMQRLHAYTESIVATVREPLLVLDAELRVQSASRSFYELFRATPEATVGKNLLELGNGQWNSPQLRRLLQEVPYNNQVDDFEMEHEFEQIGKKVMRLNARRLIQAADQPPLILLAIEDITERLGVQRGVQVSEIRFRRLFEAALDGILILDAGSQTITHVNPFLIKLLDYPAEYFIGKALWEIGFLRDKQASHEAMQQLEEHGSIRYQDLPLKDRHGRLHPVEMVANAYVEGHQRVIQCNIRDISERSQLEALLRGHASELSELHRRKDEFLAMLSHELRSPLAPIANAVQLLELHWDNETASQRQACGIIERQVRQLQHLVDDLLEVSRITTGQVQLRRERVALSSIVGGAVETVRPFIDQRGHALTVSLPPQPIWLFADAARLEQVLVNLLTNAAKYTENGGQLGLSAEQQDQTCVLRVRDTGIGIAPALLPHVFDLFTQAERSLDRAQGGLGIGLALVHRLTVLHGGTVEAQSTVGVGSEFVVRLPVAPTDDAQQPAAAPPEPTPPKALRVLVVDDNEDTVLSFSMLLEASGHQVWTACDGITAVQAAIEHRPDVMLLDIGLPGLNGYEVAKRIRQLPALEPVVLVALTGYGQETDRLASMQAGFNHHLVKPARLEQVREILATVTPREVPPA